MRNEFSPLAQLRAELLPLLPPGAFLRRDRGDALLISNASAIDSAPRTYPGFHTEQRGALTCFLPDGAWVARLEQAFPEPPDALCISLARFRGMQADADNLRLFARGAKLLDALASTGEIDAYDRALRQRAALALRGGCCGGLYACALLNAALHSAQSSEAKE